VKALRVVVADDHGLTLQGVSDSLVAQGISIVGRGRSAGLGSAQLDLYARDQWSLVRTANGMTQLIVKLDRNSLPEDSFTR